MIRDFVILVGWQLESLGTPPKSPAPQVLTARYRHPGTSNQSAGLSPLLYSISYSTAHCQRGSRDGLVGWLVLVLGTCYSGYSLSCH